MPVSSTTPGRSGARDRAPERVAFRLVDSVSTQRKDIFEAQWLAYALPYRRFADVLAGASAYVGYRKLELHGPERTIRTMKEGVRWAKARLLGRSAS